MSHRTRSLMRLLSLFACLLAASPAAAQLVGGNAYPINGVSSPPGSFATIADAAGYLVNFGTTGTGEILLELSPGYPGDVSQIAIQTISGLSSSLRLTIRPAAGYVALTSIPGGPGSLQYALKIIGSHVTLDGRSGGTSLTRDWTIRCTGQNTNGNGRTAVLIESGPGGTSDVTVTDCILEAESANSNGGIIEVRDTTTPLTSITISRNLVRSSNTASAYLRGTGITRIGATNLGHTDLFILDNVIRDVFAEGIHYGGGFINVRIEGNDIAHTTPLAPPASTSFVGIEVSSSTTFSSVSNNFVHDIRFLAVAGIVYGIRLVHQTTLGGLARAENNRVSLGGGIGAISQGIFGIDVGSTAGRPVQVDHNSVWIGGAPASGNISSAAFRRTGNSVATIRNNVFVNARSNSGTASGTHWAVSVNGTTDLTLSANDYDATGTGGVLGTTNNATSGNRTTLAQWTAAVPGDVISVSADPHFLDATGSPPDLRIDPGPPSPLESGGIDTGVDVDFEGDPRHGSPGYAGTGAAPDIGADEFDGTPLDVTPPLVTAGSLPDSPELAGRTFSNVAITDPGGVETGPGLKPRVYYRKTTNANAFLDNTPSTDGWKYVEAGGPASPFEFFLDYSLLFGAPIPGDVIEYFVAAQDQASTPNVRISTGVPASPPLSVDLTPSAFPMGGPLRQFLVLGFFSGTHTVGSGGEFTTLKTAFDAINANAVTGDVELVVLASGTNETATAALDSVNYSGGPWTIRVRPAAGTSPSISGTIAGALLKLNGADRVVIDGSNIPGGATRDLSLINNSTSTGTAAVWISSLGTGAGCTDVTVQNCVLRCGADQRSSASVTFGIVAGGAAITTTSSGPDNDFLTIRNNAIRRVSWGISVFGASNRVTGLVIEGNLIGPAAAGIDQIGRGGMLLQLLENAQITGNEIRYVGFRVGDTAVWGGNVGGIVVGETEFTESGFSSKVAAVSGNKVHDVVNFQNGFKVVGIGVSGDLNDSGNRVTNNMIWNVLGNGTGSGHTTGLRITSGLGDVVVFNSIYLRGDLDPPGTQNAGDGACALYLGFSVKKLILKNNIVAAGFESNNTSLDHFVIIGLSANLDWGSAGSDRNDYFYPAAQFPQMRFGMTLSPVNRDYEDLAAWQTAFSPPQDGHSLEERPPFLSFADLHVDESAPTEIESGGAPIDGISLDIDGDSRNPTTPDIGADEFNGIRPPSSAVPEAAPAVTTLLPPSPNPFDRATSVRFDLSVEEPVHIDVFDVQGRRVRRLTGERMAAGRHEVIWDGRGENGEVLSNGAYFVRLWTPERTWRRSVRLVK